MSIRFRLTLLYSAILALTLIVFSTLLYWTQSQITLDAITTTIQRQADSIASTERRVPRRADPSSPFMTLPGRWAQTLGPDGSIVGRSPDMDDTQLPLSPVGLYAVQNGKAWVETANIDGESILIYSEPIVVQGRTVRIVQVATSLEEREQSLGTLRLILLSGDGLALLIAFIAGWFLSGTALRPIERITHTAQTIGAERDFARRVEHEGPNDEVGQLATTFNGMLTELEASYRQVEKALQVQRRFVSDASHELRTPLTTIRGNIGLLRRGAPMDDRERTEVLSDTEEEVDRLIRLVNELLALARMDSGRVMHMESLPVVPLLEDVRRQTGLIAPNRSIQLDRMHDLKIMGDRDALKQVFLILLDNAIVHTPPSATVHISAAPISNERAEITFRDTGPGIAPEHLPHIFERFFRGSPSRTGNGTGLGLAIAQELVQAQAGELKVKSQVGRGTVFSVTLPLAAQPAS